MRTVERSQDRRDLVRDAGMGSISSISVLAGVLVAYGAVLLLLAVAAGVGRALGVETSGINDNEWRDLGLGAAVVLGVVLFVSYFFGGYVAGRMGRRAGLAHGVLVFILGLIVVAAVAAITSATADGDAITRELQNQGIPTAADDWREIGLFAGIGVLAAMLLGALLGGIKGERWHGVLVTRALDPGVRPRGEAPEAPRPTRSDHQDTEVAGAHESTMSVAASGAGDATVATPVVHRDERTPPDAADDQASGPTDPTEAERTAAARERVEQEREQTRISRLR